MPLRITHPAESCTVMSAITRALLARSFAADTDAGKEELQGAPSFWRLRGRPTALPILDDLSEQVQLRQVLAATLHCLECRSIPSWITYLDGNRMSMVDSQGSLARAIQRHNDGSTGRGAPRDVLKGAAAEYHFSHGRARQHLGCGAEGHA